MKVSDLMTKQVVTLNLHSDLELAEGLMAIMRIRHLPVVSGERLVGLVTHRDLLRASLSCLAGHDPESEDSLKVSVAVGEIMTARVATARADDDLRQAIGRMRNHKFGCLPVVDDEGKLVGIVTEADFLRLTEVLLERVDSLDLDSLRELATEVIAQ